MERRKPLAYEEFAAWVREALDHLYDSRSLQASPLVDLVADGANSLAQRNQSLRRWLLDAIREMRPNAQVPPRSRDYRLYRMLQLRYIEGLSPGEVMAELAVGRSQYFRDQAEALEALTALLWQRCPRDGPDAAASGYSRENLIRLEAKRLCGESSPDAVEMAQLFGDLRPVAERLGGARGTSVRLDASGGPKVLRADRVLLRQAILGVLLQALNIAPGGRVEVLGFAEGHKQGVRVLARPQRSDETLAPERQTEPCASDESSSVMAAMGGALCVQEGSGVWEARLTWPSPTSRLLLIVDDDEGVVELYRRYLVGLDWQIVRAKDAATARQLVQEQRPTVILLDVLLPNEDGWEFLMALRKASDACDIPVIICSVLAQAEVAVALGAAAHVTKPVTQPALLAALKPWS